MERGRQEPSQETLRRLSSALRFPESFFSQSDIEELESIQVSFRARTRMPARARDAVLSAARLAVEFMRWMETRFRLPEVEVPTLDRTMAPELAAEHVRARWGLGDMSSVSNMIHLLESRGVSVFSVPPEYADVDAFSFWWRGRPFVMLNTMKSGERGRFDAAHELGHIVMHNEKIDDEDPKTLEKDANSFASAFLMPRASVRKAMPSVPTTDEIIRTKRRWRVSALALAYRLHEMQILSDWNYRTAVIELGRLGYKAGEPDGNSRETSQLLQKMLVALRRSNVSFSNISHHLHITTDELNSYIFQLALRPLKGGGQSQTKNVQSPGLRLVRTIGS